MYLATLAELPLSARLGKTLPIRWLGGSEKLRIRLKLTTVGAWTNLSLALLTLKYYSSRKIKQAGAELGQAQQSYYPIARIHN